MPLQFCERHRLLHGRAVIQDVQIRSLKVHDSLAAGIFDVGILHVPFPRNGPIEHRRAGGNLPHAQWNARPDDVQGLPHAVTGNAAADRIEVRDEAMHRVAGHGHIVEGHHQYVRGRGGTKSGYP